MVIHTGQDGASSIPKVFKPGPGYTTHGKYAKPKGSSSLPGWFKEIRAGSDFMPTKVKPMSYNYMAMMETPYRQEVYKAPTATQTTVGKMGNAFFKPTQDVAQGIKEEHNLWQDIKNIGGSIVHKGGSLLMGALDLLSRPGYAIRNVYKDNLESYYMDPGADGKGADVTGWEAFLGFVNTVTPVGLVRDTVEGKMDDRWDAGFAGFAGKEKTTFKDLIKTTNPEFAEEHKTLTNILGVAGDIATDPITWLTMGANPGSIAKGLGAGVNLISADKAVASRLWQETIFTKAGASAGLKTVKTDIKNREMRRLDRKINKVDKKQRKIVANKKTRLTAAQLATKRKELVAAKVAKDAEDLVGAALAAKIFKKSLPTLGMTTLSRFNTGAGASTALKGAALLKAMSTEFHAGVANNLKDKDIWNAFYVANQGKDFKYTHDGIEYTVDLSKANSAEDMIFKVSQEAAPITAYAEHGTKAARSRKGRMVITEARGKDFLNQFKTHMEDRVVHALGPNVADELDAHRGVLGSRHKGFSASAEDLSSLPKVTQKDLESAQVDTTFDTLKDKAVEAWKKANPGKNYTESKVQILIEGVDGKYRKVRLSTLRRNVQREKDLRKDRLDSIVRKGNRTKGSSSVDRLMGISDEAAAARDKYVELAARLRVARETTSEADWASMGSKFDASIAAQNAADAAGIALKGSKIEPGANDVVNLIAKTILDSPELTTAELAKYKGILDDASVPLEQRIATIMNDRGMSNEEVGEVLQDVFNVRIDDNGVIHIPKGGTLDNIPDIIKAVIRDRFAARVGDKIKEASGVRLDDRPLEDVFKIVADGKLNPDAPNFMRDANSEIGMMVLDGYRAAIEYAVKNDMYQNPEILFDTIHTSMSQYMDMMSADMKAQVGNFLYHTTGLRLPDKFTPLMSEVQTLMRDKKYLWKNADGNDSKDQVIPWEELGVKIQKSVVDIFGLEDPEGLLYRHGSVENPLERRPHAGYDMNEVKESIIRDTAYYLKHKEQIEGSGIVSELNVAFEHLKTLITPIPINDNINAINRYSMIDFLLYSKEILAGHEASVVTTSLNAKRVNRARMGRLSALDSFTYTDPATVEALETIEHYKTLLRTGKDTPESTILSKLSATFAEHSGLQYIDAISMPPTGTLSDIDFSGPFGSLGIHAKLKENAIKTSAGFGPKRDADLLESMWGKESLIHEWQKSFQNLILHETFVEGRPIPQASRSIHEQIERAFAGHENLKKLLYPTKARADYSPKTVLNKDVDVTSAPTKLGVKPSELAVGTTQKLMDVRATTEAVAVAKRELQDAIEMVQAGPGSMDDPVLLKELSDARTAYLDAMKKENVAQNATGKEGSVTTAAPTGDPADFANISDEPFNFTDEERAAIQGFIAGSYAGAPPAVVAKQLHAFSMAAAADVLTAQAKLIGDLADFSIKYGAQVRFMGMPFMPMVNPMNATTTQAGVMRLDEDASRATRFWQSVWGPESKYKWTQEAHKYLSKRSQYLEGTLDNYSTSIVNFASVARQDMFKKLTEMYELAVGGGEYQLAHINALDRKKKFQLIKDNLFNPVPKGVADPLDQFVLVDGQNPVKDIAANFHDSASKAFLPIGKGWDTRQTELEKFNKYVNEKFRLKANEIDLITDAMKDPNHALGNMALMPYSIEWLREVGQLRGIETLNVKRLKDLNLGEFHTWLQDAKLRQRSGDALHNGVFSQFAFKMDTETAAMYNSQIVPGMVDTKGKQLRGEIINVRDLHLEGIPKFNIPAEFRKGEHWIQKDFVSDIKMMFDYLEDKHNINTTLDVKTLDKVLQYFKASVTIYKVPTYPVRNLIGDTFMSAMDGLVDPRYYKDASRLMMDHHQTMKDLDPRDFDELLDQNFLRKETARAAHDAANTPDAPVNPTAFNLRLHLAEGPINLNGSQIMDSFHSLGLSQAQTAGVISESMAGARQSMKGVVGGKVHDSLRDLNTIREDWSRLSHYLYALEREAPLGGSFEDITRRAATRVIKYHFDYNDVSLFDKMVLGRVLPFYKWVKNIIPFTIASVVTKPWALKVEQGLSQTISYMIDDDKNDTRRDYVVPEWIEYDSATPIGHFTDPNGDKFGQWASLYMPLSDTMKKIFGPLAEPTMDPAVSGGDTFIKTGNAAFSVLGGMFNPAFKGAIQGMTEREVWATGPSPEKGNWLTTMATMAPGYSSGESLWKFGSGMLKDKEAGLEGKNKTGTLMEELGIINVSNNTENSQLGELKRREDYYRPQLNDAKADLMNKVQKAYPNSTAEQRKVIVDEYLKITRKADPERL
jgi:hypothetical protein